MAATPKPATMKMKTADLTRDALNWAVAKCENRLWLAYENALNNQRALPPRPSEFLRDHEYSAAFAPSTDPAQAYPIIFREAITTTTMHNGSELWGAYLDDGQDFDATLQSGPTPLIAAMRCFVASQLGDEVDVPVEIQCLSKE